jgi:hypothetical protein
MNDSLKSIRSSCQSLKLSPAQFSTINDCNLSDEDIFYLRSLLRQYWNAPVQYMCHDAILQNLFYEYGFTFSDKTLLYATLAYGRFREIGKLSYKHLDSDVTYWEYMSQFQNSLMSAIHTGPISECHLFAIYLVLEGCRFLPDPKYESVHKRGYVAILRELRKESHNRSSPQFGHSKLSFLWNYSLSFLRRYEAMCFDGLRPSLTWELHDAADNSHLPAALPSLRLATPFAAGMWKIRRGSFIDWRGLEWSLQDEMATLRVCFERLVFTSLEERQGISKAAESIASVKRTLVEMGNLPYVQDLFSSVSLALKLLLLTISWE